MTRYADDVSSAQPNREEASELPGKSIAGIAPPGQRLPQAGAKLLPGMAVIALWMLFEAVYGAHAVYSGQATGQNRYGVLGIATILTGCGLGLLQRRRWGWALSLAMAVFSFCFGAYALMRLHAPQAMVMTFLNGIFFLYLVRPEVRARLR
jgi:hypothetical protein